MGSSKKSKDKHSKKDRKRRRSRSRSRSRERPSERKHGGPEGALNDDITSFIARSRQETDYSSRAESYREKDERNRDRDYQDNVDRKWRESQSRRDREYEMVRSVKDEPEEVKPSSSGGDLSLSIDDTNKLRAQLGLAPLEVGDQSGSTEKGYADRDDVHRPAKNIAEEKKAEKLKKKFEEIREKRLLRKKLEQVKTLADGNDAESTASWVQKLRQRDREKQLAAARAKQLEQMDEEFGITNLASEMFSSKAKAYSSKDLKGLRIEHDASAISAEDPVVLTLKDKGILDDDNEDILVNVNIRDDEKTAKNIENRKKGPAYKAYDDADDDSAMFKARGVLEKYDEEIDGSKQKSFRLGAYGSADLEGSNALQKMKDEMKAQQVSLEGLQPNLAKDYYTEQEMVKFNKPKRKRKVRKRIVKADDLVPLDDTLSADMGSRSKKKSSKSSAVVKQEPASPPAMDMDVDTDLGRAAIHRPEQREHETIELQDDEAELELQMALERSRRRTQKMAKDPEAIAMAVKAAAASSNDKQKQNKGLIVLDSTSEFCRALGDAEAGPSSSGGAHDAMQDSDQDDNNMDVEPTEDTAGGGWEQVTEKAAPQKMEDENVGEDERVLDDEPVVAGSVGAALRLASMKGYLESGKKKERNFAALNLPQAKIVIDEEKLRDEERGRHDRGYNRDRDRDHDRYDPYAFKEKEDYKPQVKLEYIDQHGRDLTPKEAFRYLSHKFHGKGSGKMKTEKRNKKVIDDMRLQKMSSVDTPLNLVQMMSDKQQQTSTPYVVLSGGGKNLLTSSTKLKK